MLKYTYILKDKNYKTFSITSDNKNIEKYLQAINGVYSRICWVIQKDTKTKNIKEYLVHQKMALLLNIKKLLEKS